IAKGEERWEIAYSGSPDTHMSSIGGARGFSAFKAHEFAAHSTETKCVAIGQHSGQVLATGGEDKRVNVWRIGRASNIWSLTGNSTAIESVCFDPREEFVVSGSAGGAVKLYDLTQGRMTRHLRGHMSNVTTIACSSLARGFVATGSMDTAVKLWNTDAKECVMALKGHTARVTDVQFSPDCGLLASADAEGAVKIWDLRAGKLAAGFRAGTGAVTALRFNPQELLLAAAAGDRTVWLYDVEAMAVFCTTPPESTAVRAVAFDAGGSRLFGATAGGLRQWAWDNDAAVARLERAGDVGWERVSCLHTTLEGQVMAAAALGSFVAVWAVDVDAATASSAAANAAAAAVPLS
ncbi:unnamed protein product, partial [Phaeothamnion confervicola]